MPQTTYPSRCDSCDIHLASSGVTCLAYLTNPYCPYSPPVNSSSQRRHRESSLVTVQASSSILPQGTPLRPNQQI